MPVESSSRFTANGPGLMLVAAIAAGLHHLDPQGEIQHADQIGQQHDAADQHADDRQRLPLVMLLNFAGQSANALAELVFAKQGFHGRFSCGLMLGVLAESRYSKVVAALRQ